MKKFLMILTFMAASVWANAATTVSEADFFRSGRRMIQLEVPENMKLTGQTPSGAGAPFRVLDGSKELWKGGEDESFEVHPNGTHVYLVSETAENTNWQSLKWEPCKSSKTEGKKKKKVVLRGKAGAGSKDTSTRARESGSAVLNLISNAMRHCRTGSAVTIELPKAEYHFYPENALCMSLYISNHDQQDTLPIGLPIAALKNLKINGNGSTFVFHGAMQPILLMDCEKVELNNITIRHDAPYYNEGRIVEIANGKTTLEFAPEFKWQVKDGRYYLMGDGIPRRVQAVLAFEADGRMVATGKPGDIGWSGLCERVDEKRVRFHQDASAHGLKQGQVLVLRHYGRPCPAMVLYHAHGVKLNDVVFQDSQGMALIAQRCRDIQINGGGCICAPGRLYTVSADATHFSNCAGNISVNGALYEGMMDDAINVHSTCLQIEKEISPTEIIVRYMHEQAVGFEVFAKGERLQFIKGKTLENHPQLVEAANVEWMDERHLRLTLKSPLPPGIGEGDAVENADWYPSVKFVNCTVRHNRARGALFTTPQPVLVKKCRFIGSSGSAILLAGDAQGWYESGRCLDVQILNNTFDHNLIQRYQFTEGIISIYPMVKQPQEQAERYHRNIRIEGNTFLTHRVPLIYAISTEGLTFRNNKVKFDDKHAPMHNGQPYVLQYCDNTTLQKL